MAEGTTTNIILDNNPCRHVPSNDLAALMVIDGWGKYVYDNQIVPYVDVFGRRLAYWIWFENN
jgi:hypothetical protein